MQSLNAVPVPQPPIIHAKAKTKASLKASHSFKMPSKSSQSLFADNSGQNEVIFTQTWISQVPLQNSSSLPDPNKSRKNIFSPNSNKRRIIFNSTTSAISMIPNGHFKDESQILRHTKILEKLKGDPLGINLAKVGNAFEDAFSDLLDTLPQYRDLFIIMKEISTEIKKKGLSHNKPIDRQKIVSQNGKYTPTSTFYSQMQDFSCSTEEKPKPSHFKIGIHKKFDSSKALSTFATEAKQDDENVKPLKTKISVPKLNMRKLSMSVLPDYNDEFMEKFDEFSGSWRKDASNFKTNTVMEDGNKNVNC